MEKAKRGLVFRTYCHTVLKIPESGRNIFDTLDDFLKKTSIYKTESCNEYKKDVPVFPLRDKTIRKFVAVALVGRTWAGYRLGTDS